MKRIKLLLLSVFFTGSIVCLSAQSRLIQGNKSSSMTVHNKGQLLLSYGIYIDYSSQETEPIYPGRHVEILYSPIDKLGVHLKFELGSTYVQYEASIGTYKYSGQQLENLTKFGSHFNYFDCYVGFNKSLYSFPNSVKIKSNTYFIRGGYHIYFKKVLSLSFSTGLNVTDFTQYNIYNTPTQENFDQISSINQNDPYLYPEVGLKFGYSKGRIALYVKRGKLFLKRSTIYVPTAIYQAGITINLTRYVVKKQVKEIE